MVSHERLLKGLISILDKNGEDCVLVDARIIRGKRSPLERKYVVYRKGDLIKLVPDAISNRTFKRTTKKEEDFNPVEWIFQRELSLKWKVKITDINRKRITDPAVAVILNKLHRTDLTIIKE